MRYTFNGETYKTEEEANAAQQQYVQDKQNDAMAAYADAASVGFDETRFNMLMQSGSGLSQMSADERKYIQKNYQPSYSTKYKNSAADQYLASVGLPPSSELNKYREKYAAYSASGSFEDNYGGVSDDQWKKINELWAKDWEYGFTADDALRQAHGVAPASYDSMYEDTRLDDELRAKGLPPSKLLKGKLGEAYNAWAEDDRKYNDFMTEVSREWSKLNGMNADREDAERLARETYAAMGRTDTPSIRAYTFDDALSNVLARPEFTEFATKHFGQMSDLPDRYADKYAVKDEFGNVMTDENGNNVYDPDAWMKDYSKALSANEKLSSDEFAITSEKAQAFYDANIEQIKAEDYAKEAIRTTGINPLTATAEQQEKLVSVYTGLQAEPFTVRQIFPDATSDQVQALQPFVNKLNDIMKTDGISAAQEYLNTQFRRDVQGVAEQDIVASYRQQYPESQKTDDEIKDEYYNRIATSYGMSDEQKTSFRSGELSVTEYMRGVVKTGEDAQKFATDRITRELNAQGLSETLAELKAEQDRLYKEYDEIDEDDPNGYAKRNAIDERLAEIEGPIARAEASELSYYAEAVQYASDFTVSTQNADQKFSEIVNGMFYDRSINWVSEELEQTRESKNQVNRLVQNATDEEKAAAVYFSKDPELSERYVKQLAVKYSNQTVEARKQMWADYYNSLGGFGKLLTGIAALNVQILAAPLEGAYNFVKQTVDMFAGKDAYAADMASMSSDAFGAIAGEVERENGKFIGTVYQMAPSFVQSVASGVAAAFTGGATEALTLAAMSMQSYSSTAQEALLNGATTEQAWTLGVVSGVSEALFEKISLGTFVENINFASKAYEAALKSGTSAKSTFLKVALGMLANTTLQGSVEASEEGATSLANLFAENLILGYDSSYEQRKQHLIEAGYTEGEASAQAGKEIFDEVKRDMALGFASGALMTFGSNIVMVGSTPQIDPTGTRRFLTAAHNLSAIDVDTALDLARRNEIRDADGRLTRAGADRIVNALLRKGADAATIEHVRNEITDASTPASAMTVFDNAVRETRIKNETTLAKAALRVAANTAVRDEEETRALEQDINNSVRDYLNNLSDTLQTADRAHLSEAVQAIRNGFVDEIMARTGYAHAVGHQILNDYIASLATTDEDAAAFEAGTASVMAKLKQAGLTGDTDAAASRLTGYAGSVYALVRASQDSRFSKAFSDAFSVDTDNLSETILNACLNTTDAEHVGFADLVAQAIGTYASMEDSNLAKTLGSGMNDIGYVASLLASSASRKIGSNSRTMYDYAAQNGTTRSMLDALAAVSYYDNLSDTTRRAADRYVISHDDAFMTADERNALSAESESAAQSAESKRNLVASHERHNAQTLATADNIVQRHQAASDAVRGTETVTDTNGNVFQTTSADLADVAASIEAALSDAINARNNLAQANADRLESAKADLAQAERKLSAAQRKFRTSMIRHSAAYVNMIGSQIEVMRGGDTVSPAEFDRITALAANGTREDLNDVKTKIAAAEKRQAVCLGNEMGISVEVVKFTPDFFAELGVKNGNESARGLVKNGKVYLNESVWESRVGYGTDEVIWHEFAHVAELSADNYGAFADMAYDYMCEKYGKEYIDNWIADNGREELVAEFAGRELMTDARAIRSLCSVAPVMSTRLYQWLNRISARHNNTIPQMRSIMKAQRAFAKALGTRTTAPQTGTVDAETVVRTNEAFAARNEIEEINTENRAEQEDVETATVKAEERETAEETRYEIDRQENEETEPEPTAEAPVEEQAAETAETAQEEPAEQPEPVTLPFELPQKTQSLIDSFVKGKADHAIGGKVGPDTNKSIRNLVTNQVNRAAAELGVSVSADVVRAYADQYTLPEIETSGDSWVSGYKPTQESNRSESSFARLYNSTENSDAEYYTEFKPVRDTLNSMTESERNRYGNTRLVSGRVNGKDCMLAVRNVSAEGFTSGNPVAGNARNIALLFDANKLVSAAAPVVHRIVGLSDSIAAVVPGGVNYGAMRAEARKNGVNVVTYDESEPSQFEKAVGVAARSNDVKYYTDFEKSLKQYGWHKQGMQPRVEGRLVPRQTAANNRVSQMMRTIAESPFTSDAGYTDIQQMIMDGIGTFAPTTNERTITKARTDIDRVGGAAKALEKLNMDIATGNGKLTDLLATAEALYMDRAAMESFTDEQREQLVSNLSIVAHEAGTALQLTQSLKRMSPQGHVFYIEQIARRMADRYQKRTGKPVDLALTEEERQAYKNAQTPEELKAIDSEVVSRWTQITEQLTGGEMLRNWRYFSMLGNFRTHIRNIFGNTLMYPIVRMKDSISSVYQLGLDKSERTTTFATAPLSTETRAYVREALDEALPIMQGVSAKYLDEVQRASKNGQPSESKLKQLFADVASTHVTKGKTAVGRVLNVLSSGNSNLLEYEDALFLGARFRSAFAQQIQAKGLNVANITQAQRSQMMNLAMEESLRATFRDANAIADALNNFQRSHKVAGFLMESIVPFKKTPLNIVRRSVEYSPIGLIQGGYKAISNKVQFEKAKASINAMDISDAEKQSRLRAAEASFKSERIAAIDRLAAGTTGSILTALGVLAASLGWITIGRKDDDSASFETALGRNAYSLNIGDVSIDLSAFAPAAVPLLMGTALYEAMNDSGADQSVVSEVIEVLCETLDPITEMSMLSGIADALNGVSYSRQDDGAKTQYLSTIGLNAAKSYIGQYIPTIIGQVARVTDPYARSYSAGGEYFASSIAGPEVGSAVKNLQNKIPFVAWLSEPKVDLHGNPVRNYTNFGDWVLHAANNFILPATIKVDRKNEIDDELVRLYGVTDGGNIFPEKPSRYIGTYTDSKTKKPVSIRLQNDAEYTEYQEEYGQMVYDALESLMSSGSYSRMTDEQKASVIEDTITNVKNQVRKLWKAKKSKKQ